MNETAPMETVECTIGGDREARNQLEKTNHDHLGKLITYASGLGAKTMIWIAKEITDEHRRAIDFLNENSGLNMRLYAIQVQAGSVYHHRHRCSKWWRAQMNTQKE